MFCHSLHLICFDLTSQEPCHLLFSIQKVKLFSLLKIKEDLKWTTKIALPILMRVFSKLAYCTAIFRFAIKSRFQQLPNLTIHSLLKNKEGLKQSTKIVRRVASPPCYRVFARSQDWQTKTLIACFNASFEKIERTFFQL